ncbi:MAG TPA: hypothetical protein VMR14_16630 [Streptosporangiaceae bacterium]|jgi:hypothetical protein|nr:hypothetical protein [Streptosporangiaceae bacterium]
MSIEAPGLAAGGEPIGQDAAFASTGSVSSAQRLTWLRLTWLRLAWLRLAWLYLASRRLPTVAAGLIGCGIALRVALHWHWDTYGALQLPLIAEAAAASIVAVSTGSPFGEPERVTGRWLPVLRLGSVLAATAIALAGLLIAGATATHLAGGSLDVLRNTAGLIGIGLLASAAVGSALSWAGPLGYLVIGVYALYGDWHGQPLTSPWIWPGRPVHDFGAALAATLVFVAGVAVVTRLGPRLRAQE